MLGGCKVNKFRIEPKEGGTVDLMLRIGSNDIDAAEAGLLCSHLSQMINITLNGAGAACADDRRQCRGVRGRSPGRVGGGPFRGESLLIVSSRYARPHTSLSRRSTASACRRQSW